MQVVFHELVISTHYNKLKDQYMFCSVDVSSSCRFSSLDLLRYCEEYEGLSMNVMKQTLEAE